MGISLHWDDGKARRNLEKHGLSFDSVRPLFTSGADYLEIYDFEHSLEEDRFICIGPIATGIVLVVVTNPEEDVIRIVSARRATARETAMYSDFMKERLR
jgi:uncharacterized DUF497 family protein